MDKAEWNRYRENLLIQSESQKLLERCKQNNSYNFYYLEQFTNRNRQDIGCIRRSLNVRLEDSNRVTKYHNRKKEVLKRELSFRIQKSIGCTRFKHLHLEVERYPGQCVEFKTKYRETPIADFRIDKHWMKFHSVPFALGLGGEVRLITRCSPIEEGVGMGIDLYHCDVLSFTYGTSSIINQTFVAINSEYKFFAQSKKEKEAVKNLERKVGRFVAGKLKE